MIKHVWSVICSKSSIDKDTNNVSLFEVLEQLSFDVARPDAEKVKKTASDEQIVAPINFELVTLLDREPAKGKLSAEIRAEIVEPAGKTLGNFCHAFNFTEDRRRMRVTLRIAGMSVTTTGIYRVLVMLKEQNVKDFKVVAEIPLEVAVNFN